jgi:hypothetical protein
VSRSQWSKAWLGEVAVDFGTWFEKPTTNDQRLFAEILYEYNPSASEAG